jgi:CheY-like chemotaxis protein
MAEKTLLVVDDDPQTLWTMARLMEMRGWRVERARSVGGAFEALAQGPAPDCVILDLMLPDGDGAKVLRYLREAGLPTRVVVTSAVVDPGRLDAVDELAPDAVILKPVDIDEVSRACEGSPLSDT